MLRPPSTNLLWRLLRPRAGDRVHDERDAHEDGNETGEEQLLEGAAELHESSVADAPHSLGVALRSEEEQGRGGADDEENGGREPLRVLVRDVLTLGRFREGQTSRMMTRAAPSRDAPQLPQKLTSSADRDPHLARALTPRAICGRY